MAVDPSKLSMAFDPSKLQTQIDIKPPPPPFFTESAAETLQEPKLSFFASRYRRPRRRRADTWLISLFVILHIVAFMATMVVNDCWSKSHGDCVLKAFGRLSFQPLPENPLLGPSASTWASLALVLKLIFCLILSEDEFSWWNLGRFCVSLCGFSLFVRLLRKCGREVKEMFVLWVEVISFFLVRFLRKLVSSCRGSWKLCWLRSGCCDQFWAIGWCCGSLIRFSLFGCWENKGTCKLIERFYFSLFT